MLPADVEPTVSRESRCVESSGAALSDADILMLFEGFFCSCVQSFALLVVFMKPLNMDERFKGAI